MGTQQQRDKAILKESLDSEINNAIINGAKILMFFGAGIGTLGILLWVSGNLEFGLLPSLMSYYCAVIALIAFFIARHGRFSGIKRYLVVIPFVFAPVLFYLAAAFVFPQGIAAFINGPVSHSFYPLIFLTAFFFDFRLSVISGLGAGVAYFIFYAIAREDLLKLQADPALHYDMAGVFTHGFKAVLMMFCGILAGGISVIAKHLVMRSMESERDTIEINRMFGQYVSDNVREKILSDNAKIAGERKTVAVLFSDIRSFTNYCERYPPEKIIPQLNEYLDMMVECITRNGGVIDKFIGDAVMATFGGLVEIDNPCEAALKASIEIRQGLRKLNEKWEKAGIAGFQNGIGVHFGEVVQGTIGSENRKEFTVIGDSVNMASRIEGLTKNYPYQIIFTVPLYKQLSGDWQERSAFVDHVSVRGKTGTFPIYGIPDE